MFEKNEWNSLGKAGFLAVVKFSLQWLLIEKKIMVGIFYKHLLYFKHSSKCFLCISCNPYTFLHSSVIILSSYLYFVEKEIEG